MLASELHKMKLAVERLPLRTIQRRVRFRLVHSGDATQGGLRAGVAGFAQGDELGRDFDQQDVGRLELRLGLGHDGTPFRPPGVDAVGESKPHRAQARQGLRSNSPRP